MRGGAVVGGFVVGAADAAVPVVGGDRGQVAVAEPDAGLPLPLPRRTGGPRAARAAGTSLGEQPEHAAGFDGAELGGVAGGDDPGSGLPGRLADHGQVGGAELAGLVQDEHVVLVQRDGAAQLVGAFDLAEELGDVVALGQALVRQDPGGVGGGGQADDAAAGEGGPQPGELGHGVALARPGRGDQHGGRRGRGEHHHHGVALLGVQPGPLGGGPGLLAG